MKVIEMPNIQLNNSHTQLLDKKSLRILKLYNLYRLILSLIFIGFIYSGLHDDVFKLSNYTLLSYGAWAYLIINGFLLSTLLRNVPSFVVFVVGLLDISLLIVLFYAAGGIPSGLANLILVAVALNNILLPRRLGLSLAALAAVGVIYLTFYLSLDHPESATQFYVHAGAVGTLSFAVAFIIQTLAKRLQVSEHLAISHAAEAANLEALNNLILQRMHTGILLIDQQHKIILANNSAQTMFNCNTLQGRVLDPHSPLLIQRLEEWQSNPSRQVLPFKISDGSLLLQPTFIEQRYKAQRHIIIFLDDTTQVVQKAQHLKLVSLGRLTASIAHEIRNPLGAIDHAAQLLFESDVLDKHDQRLAQIIQDNSRRMNTIIENILQLSRQRRAEPDLIDLSSALRQFLERFKLVKRSAVKLHLQIAADGIVTRVDQQQLNQVLDNLVSNAIHHCSKKHRFGEVWIRLYLKVGTKQPILEVTDNGPGIPFSQQSQIFEPFFTTENKGTGLGLYISAQLCESNAARLDYVNLETKGACFRITFAHSPT